MGAFHRHQRMGLSILSLCRTPRNRSRKSSGSPFFTESTTTWSSFSRLSELLQRHYEGLLKRPRDLKTRNSRNMAKKTRFSEMANFTLARPPSLIK